VYVLKNKHYALTFALGFKFSLKASAFAGKVYFVAAFIVGNLLADRHYPLGCGPLWTEP
jgi:hypothetical protein